MLNIHKDILHSYDLDILVKALKVINYANHYVFISNPVETEKMIRDFYDDK
jgi:hypothetical protein